MRCRGPDLEAATTLAGEFMQTHIDNGIPDPVRELREIAGGELLSSTLLGKDTNQDSGQGSFRVDQEHNGRSGHV